MPKSDLNLFQKPHSPHPVLCQINPQPGISSEHDRLLAWIINYLTDEGFPVRHLTALSHIIGLFNDSEAAEQEIFDFAERLYAKYAK